MWSLVLTISLVAGSSLASPAGPLEIESRLDSKEEPRMSTEITPTVSGEPAPRGRLLFGLIPGGRSGGILPSGDTTELPVSSRVARDVQWEVARRWGVDPDRVRLRFGLVSGAVPERITAVRILGTGTKGHWIALLSPADPNETPARVRVRAGGERLDPVAGRALVRG